MLWIDFLIISDMNKFMFLSLKNVFISHEIIHVVQKGLQFLRGCSKYQMTHWETQVINKVGTV